MTNGENSKTVPLNASCVSDHKQDVGEDYHVNPTYSLVNTNIQDKRKVSILLYIYRLPVTEYAGVTWNVI